MSEQAAQPIPAGWYPDPDNSGRGRFWDGTAWTDLYHTPGQPYPAMPAPKAPPGTNWNTIWIWLIVAIPVLPLIMLMLVPWGSIFAFDVNDPYAATYASLSIFASPAYWLSLLLGWAVYGLNVFFAYRDVKELTGRGVPQPFHWAWAFLSSAVYVIGRSVVVKRRTGEGSAPLWAAIGYFVLSFVVVIVIMVMMFSGMGDLFRQIRTS